MDIVISAILFIFIITWAYRVEVNTKKTQESMRRIEQMMTENKEKK